LEQKLGEGLELLRPYIWFGQTTFVSVYVTLTQIIVSNPRPRLAFWSLETGMARNCRHGNAQTRTLMKTKTLRRSEPFFNKGEM